MNCELCEPVFSKFYQAFEIFFLNPGVYNYYPVKAY